MTLVLEITLFLSLLGLFIFVFVPLSKYDTTPAKLTEEFIKNKLENYFTSDDTQEKMDIISRSTNEVMKYATIIGSGLGILTILATIKWLSVLALIPGILATLLGIIITKKVLENEFKRWQAELFQGVPPLINFMPAFLEVGSLTVTEAIRYTIPFLPQPFKAEVQNVINLFLLKGQSTKALDDLAQKAKHPIIDAICLRLDVAWTERAESDLFVDLVESIDNENEKAIAQATVAKSGMFALIAVACLLGAMPIFGYPAVRFIMEQMSAGFGL